MSCNISDHVVRGELDNRVRGKIEGRIWLAGREVPLQLELKGDGGPDIRGRLLTFTNSDAGTESALVLETTQRGRAGEMTASKKVRERGGEELAWSNWLSLEWFSEREGRIVICGPQFRSSISEPAWKAEDLAGDGVTGEWIVDSVLSASEADRETAEAIERVLRINDLKYEAERLTGGEIVHTSAGPIPPEVQERFWQEVVELESGPTVPRLEMLASDGLVPRPPDDLGEEEEEELRRELWRVIEALAHRRTFLDCTDHLSDRDLYVLLYERVLPESTTLLEPDSAWSCHLSIHEYGTSDDEDGVLLYLRYYADDATRGFWKDDFPNEELPEREDPPFDRDRFLPQCDVEPGLEEGDEFG